MSFADTGITAASSIVRKIYRACRSSLIEPDLALNLAIADYINDKQGSIPREAAVTIVNLINSKHTHTAVFALALLDVLVKNCGYPFHLQISRKEFLNDLVKRFPEKPPYRYTKVQKLILGAIEEWNQTICKTSRYKADLGFIRDMHRLLTYKGYTFPEVKAEDASVLNPSDNLKSIEEIQKEEAIAQAAKLQELVRRGRPSDLKEANKLMKIMAGFKDDNIVESRAKVAEDLNKLRRKADIFAEMLAAGEQTGQIDTNDETLVELYSALKASQPKIQKIIDEEQDDEQAVQNLLKLNDIVNSLIEKFQLMKNRDVSSASKIQVKSSGDLVNLIDFGDDTDGDPSPSLGNNGNQSKSNNTIDDLLGLDSLKISNSTNTNFGLGSDIQLNSSFPQQQSQPSSSSSSSQPNYDVFAQLSKSSAPQSHQPLPPQSNSLDLLGDFQPSSSTQQPTQAQSSRSTVNESQHLKFEISTLRQSPTSIEAKAFFSNLKASSISDFQFLIAVPKSLQLQLHAQIGSFLPAFGKDSVSQSFTINGATQGVPVKIKWKVNYVINSLDVEETNTYTFPPISI